MKQGKILRSVTEKIGLQVETAPGVLLVELSGDDRILVENHKCVVGYTDCEIQIRVSFGLVQITGEKLELSCINKEQLVIRGSIRTISLIK